MDYKSINYSLEFPKKIEYFNETDINHTIKIFEEEKLINKIISIKSNIKIGDTEIIRTPIMISNDNERFTGCKLAVELKIDEFITYMSGVKKASLEVIRNNIIKNIFITIPTEYKNLNAIDLLRRKRIKISPYLEDIYGKLISDKEININIAIFIDVNFLEE